MENWPLLGLYLTSGTIINPDLPSGNNTNLIQFIYSSRQWLSLSAIIFIIIIIWSAFIVRSRATEIVNHDIIYN